MNLAQPELASAWDGARLDVPFRGLVARGQSGTKLPPATRTAAAIGATLPGSA